MIIKKKYSVICLSADGKYCEHFTISAVSFSDAYRTVKLFSKHSGLSIKGIIEEKILSDSFNLLNY